MTQIEEPTEEKIAAHAHFLARQAQMLAEEGNDVSARVFNDEIAIFSSVCRALREARTEVRKLRSKRPATPRDQLSELVEYINALFVSGNDRPVTSTLFGKESWEVIKGLLDDGLPLDYSIVESECVYRRKLAAYGDETRATSPLIAWREKHGR